MQLKSIKIYPKVVNLLLAPFRWFRIGLWGTVSTGTGITWKEIPEIWELEGSEVSSLLIKSQYFSGVMAKWIIKWTISEECRKFEKDFGYLVIKAL